MVRSFFAKEDGQGLVEYALILVLIAIVVIGILTLLGGKISQVFSNVNSGLHHVSTKRQLTSLPLVRRGGSPGPKPRPRQAPNRRAYTGAA